MFGRRQRNRPAPRVRSIASPIDAAILDAEPGGCPNGHGAGRVYRSDLEKGLAFVVCDECGRTWKVDARPAVRLADYCTQLADDFDAAAEFAPHDDIPGNCVLFERRACRDVAALLRRLVELEAELPQGIPLEDVERRPTTRWQP